MRGKIIPETLRTDVAKDGDALEMKTYGNLRNEA
jgi:hypothetical protein